MTQKNLGNFFFSGENGFTDDTGNNTIQNTNCILDATIKRFGDNSLALNGTDAYLTSPTSSDFQFGLDDFTIDFWINFSNSVIENDHIIEQNDGTNRWQFWRDNSYWRVFANTGIDFQIQDADLSPGTWYHMALVRKDGVFKIYKNGSLLLTDSEDISDPFPTVNGPLYIGSYAGTGQYFGGNLDNIRITKGTALWESEFELTPASLFYVDTGNNTVAIYGIGSRGNLRGECLAGFIRPTIKQFFTSENYSRIKKIPKNLIGYTTDQCNGGVATASKAPYDVYGAFDGDLSFDHYKMWFLEPPINSLEWLQYEFTEPKRIRRLRLYSFGFGSGMEPWNTIVLKGSNDGVNFTSIYSATNPDGGTVTGWSTHSFNNDKLYSIYRIDTTFHYGNGGNGSHLAEVEMMEGVYSDV